MNNGGVTQEELSLLLSHVDQAESLHSVNTSSFLPRSKRQRQRKTWLFGFLQRKKKA